MRKRLLILITFLLIAGSIAGWFFFARESRYLGTSPFKAVPLESPFFIRVRDFGGFAAKTVKNSSWKSLGTFPKVAELYSYFVFIDSLSNHHKELEKILKGKEMIYVPGDSSKLFIVKIGSISEKNKINGLINSYFQGKNILAAGEEFKAADIQKYEWKEQGAVRKLFVVFYQGLLIAGNDFPYLCSAISQMDLTPITSDPGFVRVKTHETENIDLNIFINHSKFPQYLSTSILDSVPSAILHPDYARWTEIDLIQKENQLLVSGLSVTDSTFVSYLDVFRHQVPGQVSLTQFMPSNTSFFVVQNLSDVLEYFRDNRGFLEKSGRYSLYRDNLSEISGVLDLDIEKYLKENWKGEAATVFLNYNLERSSDNRFLLLKIKSGPNDPLVQAIKRWNAANKSSFTETEYREAVKYSIWKMPGSNFGQLLGEYCFDPVSTKFMTVIDDFILFGDSPGSVKRYLNHLRSNELLIKNGSFIQFSSGLARTSNYYLWSAPGQSLPFFSSVLDQEFYQNLVRRISALKKIEYVAWQWSYENGVVYNSASFNFNSNANTDPVPLWSYRLQGKMIGKPFFISRSQDGSEGELVFQDNENVLISLDKDGIEKWKVRLEGPVMGTVKMIDYFRNGTLQMLFNTRNAIHLIGENGSEIKNFPVRLRSAATNEISVFDYDGRKNYRFLVACRDRKVYCMDKYCKLIPGWQTKTTTGTVELPVRYFMSGTREYLFFSDKKHTYVVDRQGKERIRIKEEFNPSFNNIFQVKEKDGQLSFVTTDEKGQIQFIGLNGSLKKLTFGRFSGEHFFLPLDPTGNGSAEFLFSDHKIATLFDLSGNQIFTRDVNILIDNAPSLKMIGNERLIELYSAAERKAVILKSDGSILNEGLPEKFNLQTIGMFSKNSSVASLVAYSQDGVLANFQIKVK